MHDFVIAYILGWIRLTDLAHCSIVVWAVLLGKVSVLKLQQIKMKHVTG